MVDDAKRARVEAGHTEPGWLAKRGAIPIGYLGDPAKTAATFPVIEGERMSVPGDRARLRADGLIELLGRESMTINSGGEKIFAEEVEQALISHPDVDDALVVGRPSVTWGAEVVAVVTRVHRRRCRSFRTKTCWPVAASPAGRLASSRKPPTLRVPGVGGEAQSIGQGRLCLGNGSGRQRVRSDPERRAD